LGSVVRDWFRVYKTFNLTSFSNYLLTHSLSRRVVRGSLAASIKLVEIRDSAQVFEVLKRVFLRCSDSTTLFLPRVDVVWNVGWSATDELVLDLCVELLSMTLAMEVGHLILNCTQASPFSFFLSFAHQAFVVFAFIRLWKSLLQDTHNAHTHHKQVHHIAVSVRNHFRQKAHVFNGSAVCKGCYFCPVWTAAASVSAVADAVACTSAFDH